MCESFSVLFASFDSTIEQFNKKALRKFLKSVISLNILKNEVVGDALIVFPN